MVFRIEKSAVQSLINYLRQEEYSVVAPTLRSGSIVYDEVSSASQLPEGWTDVQTPGHYTLRKRSDDALFGFAVGPHSWKKFLFPPTTTVLQAVRKRNGFSVNGNGKQKLQKYAFFGVRPCELKAIEIQDKVFASGEYRDPTYSRLREQLFIVGVNCSSPSDSCFCTSMGTGPKATSKCDLLLTEIIDQGDHYFIVEAATSMGQRALESVEHRKASEEEVAQAEAVIAQSQTKIRRKLDTEGIKDLLYKNIDHPEWDNVGERCLSCANCTMVCPTCFCNTIEDETDLDGNTARRTRKWDSCFTLEFSYIHGGSIRVSAKSRYRQWMTHKLAAWQDQFGTSGCVGCGRCITWCPVGIDITDEARVIRETKVPS
jgi:sulfhydrogenase subunit beta (sulfur reductase)